MFRRAAPALPVDCVGAASDDASPHSFFSGGQDGDVALWSVARKKPVAVVRHAHGGRWVGAVGGVAQLIVSGAHDGQLRLWDGGARLAPLASAPVPGFVSALHVAMAGDGNEGRRLRVWCATGTEHRQGRWWSTRRDYDTLGEAACRGARNTVYVMDIALDDDDDE